MPPSALVRKPPRGYRVALTTEERDPALREGLDLARTTARRLGLWSRYRSGEATDAQRRRMTERISLDARRQVGILADRFLAGTIGRLTWQDRMRDLVVPRLYAGVAAMLGGSLSDADRAWAEAEVRRQLGYLKRFGTEIGTGDQSFDGTIRNRADHYGAAVWVAGQGALLRRAIEEDEATEARRVLGVADHCRSHGGLTGCIEQAALGWQPIEEVNPIGDSPCRSRCHCHLVFR